MERRYYTYAYLNEDGTIYYVGKGTGQRAYTKTKDDTVKCPEDKNKIIFLKQNLTEEEAFAHEKYMIDVLGRVNHGGILQNKRQGNVIKKSNQKKGKIDEILDNKNESLVAALKLVNRKIDLEVFLDNLIQDITEEYTMTPFELFCYHYTVEPTDRYKDIFEESFLGKTLDVKININNKELKPFCSDCTFEAELESIDIEEVMMKSRLIWKDEGYYFKSVKVSEDYIGEEEYVEYIKAKEKSILDTFESLLDEDDILPY